MPTLSKKHTSWEKTSGEFAFVPLFIVHFKDLGNFKGCTLGYYEMLLRSRPDCYVSIHHVKERRFLFENRPES
jgi:hypothetical protein